MRLAASIAALLMLSACGGGGDEGGSAPAPAAEAPALTDAQKQEIVAALPAPYNTADIKAGQGKYGMCRSCHTLTEGGARMTGPNLHGLLGSKAATRDFNYSAALKAANLTWDAPTLDKWIEDPRAMVPGTKMAFVGIKDAKARIDLIGYLAVEAGSAQ